MDDQSLNHEIESALNVDPSPEFLARVRTRIAAEPEPRRWRLAPRNAVKAFRPALLMAPAFAAVVLVVMLWPRSEAPLPARVEPAPAPVAAAQPAPLAELPHSTSSAPLRQPAVRRTVVESRQLVVVINAAEVAAFNRLVARIEMGSLPTGADVVAAPGLPAEVDIAPITIAPIAFVASAEQGELQ